MGVGSSVGSERPDRGEAFGEFGGGHAGKIRDDSVVRQDSELTRGKTDGEEVVVGFISGMSGVSVHQRGRRPFRGCRTVVPIGNIKCVEPGKGFRIGLRIIHLPALMGDAVLGFEAAIRF